MWFGWGEAVVRPLKWTRTVPVPEVFCTDESVKAWALVEGAVIFSQNQ